jgi:hypothetical protein
MKVRYPTNKGGRVEVLANAAAFDLKLFVERAEAVLEELQELLQQLQSEEYSQLLKDEGIST